MRYHPPPFADRLHKSHIAQIKVCLSLAPKSPLNFSHVRIPARVIFDRRKGHAQLALLSVLLAYLSFCSSPSSVMGLFCVTLAPPQTSSPCKAIRGDNRGQKHSLTSSLVAATVGVAINKARAALLWELLGMLENVSGQSDGSHDSTCCVNYRKGGPETAACGGVCRLGGEKGSACVWRTCVWKISSSLPPVKKKKEKILTFFLSQMPCLFFTEVQVQSPPSNPYLIAAMPVSHRLQGGGGGDGGGAVSAALSVGV